MDDDKKPRCATCAFFEEPDPKVLAAAYGTCRRRPPLAGVTRLDPTHPLPMWPPTAPSDWCGEWRDQQKGLE